MGNEKSIVKKTIKKKAGFYSPAFFCDRDRIRTCDRLLRRQMLYPAELRDRLMCEFNKLIAIEKKNMFYLYLIL